MIATKDQEREALKKIRKIVADLGQGSYLSFAFEGCFDIAEDNITNDFADSYYHKYESCQAKLDTAEKDIKALLSQNDELQDNIKALERDRDKWRDSYENTLDIANDLEKDLIEKEGDADKIKKLEAEIITLKAKLYDLMIK